MNDPHHIVQIIPGTGWWAHYSHDDGDSSSSPIVAWALLANGDVRALDTDRNGDVDFATDITNFERIEGVTP